MKRIYFSIIALFLFIALVGCETNQLSLDEVLDGITLEFKNDDAYNAVTEDINLVIDEKIAKDLVITWQSSDEEVASVVNQTVLITRSLDENVTVTLSATFTFSGQTKSKVFTFIVIQQLDNEGPIVTGSKNYTIKLGDDVPNYLAGVVGVDTLSNPVTLSIDDSAVDYQTPGVYDVIITAIDSRLNETQVTITLTIQPLNTYTVIFKDEDNTIDTIELNEKQTLNQPLDPVKPGYVFYGWYADQTLSTPFVFDELITLNTTIYARFEKILDINSPILFGVIDIHYVIGQPKPQLLLNVTATDDVSSNVIVLVDDTEVDYDQAGIYNIYYYATDEAMNEASLSVKIYITEPTVAEAMVETFDLAPATGSSYKTESFVGNENISWSFVGMRSDVILNGDALTFGASASNYLRGTFTQGISSFSMEAAHAYSGNTTREVSLYINDILITKFDITAGPETYSVTDLNITGSFTLELRNTGGQRVTLDDISITPKSESPESNMLTQDKNNLQLNTVFMTNGTLQLPNQGLNGSQISYTYALSSNPNNHLINLSNGVVTVPVSGVVTVSIKAILTLGSLSMEKIFNILLGEGDPVSIYNAKNATGAVKTKGIITAIVEEVDFYRLFLEDSTAAMQVLLPKQGFNVVVGEEIIIKGSVSNQVLQQVTQLTSNGVKTISLTEVTAEDLSANPSKMVIFTGLVQQDYTTGALLVVTESGIITVLNKTTSGIFSNLKLGQEVVVIGNVYLQSGVYQVWVTDAIDFESRAYDATLLSTFIEELLAFESPQTVTSNIVLPTTDDYFNTVISWVSSNPSVVSNTGVFTKPSESTNLTLTYTIKLAGVTLSSGVIHITAEGAPTLSNYYISATGLSGTALKSELTRIISNAKSSSYDAAKEILSKADTVVGNTGLLYLIYDSRTTVAKWDGASTWNREHVWPDSKLGNAATGEPHNLRASTVSVNSSRGNLAFVSGSGSYGRVGSGWYPGDTHKGDVARIILYMHVRWGLSISSSVIGDLDMFLRWHTEDPVDDFEIHRNSVIYSYVNNRNPFIDHPEFATMIWGVPSAKQEANRTIEALPFDLSFELPLLEPVIYYQPKKEFINLLQ